MHNHLLDMDESSQIRQRAIEELHDECYSCWSQIWLWIIGCWL